MGQLKDKNGNNFNPTTTTNDVTDGNQTLEERLQSIESGSGSGGNASVEKTGTKLEGVVLVSSDIGTSVSTSESSSHNVYVYDVTDGEKLTIYGSCPGSGTYTPYLFADKMGRVLKKPSFPYSSAVQTYTDVVVPENATKLYVNENYSANGASSKVLETDLDGKALASYRNALRDDVKISEAEMSRYYALGAAKMDNYNLVNETVGFIVIGQSNADGRIPAADFPATANINGTDIALSKSIPTCKYVKGGDGTTYNESSSQFAAYNNTGMWSFDQVVYNAIANALGDSDFYVCKQTRGGTPLLYNYPTSFDPDIDLFKFNSGYYSQLLHLKFLVERALELQPSIKFKAIIMHQGETDGGIKLNGPYYIKLCRMIQWIRGLVGSPDLPFIFGTVPSNSTAYSTIINDDMTKAAQDMKNVYCVTIGDASDWVNDQFYNSETGKGAHFGANTAVKLADDMYKLMVNNKMFKI